MKYLKLTLATLWLVLLLSLLLSWWYSQLPLNEIPHLLSRTLLEFGLLQAAGVYIFIYAIRPLTLFPATLLTVASGLIFGPWLGTLFTIIGENASANLAFLVSRWFGRSSVEKHSSDIIKRWDRKLQDNALVAVITMRLLMLPFDAVNFGCGLTAMRQRDYAIGTTIGILPSLIGFVLLGGAAAAGINNRLLILILSFLFMVSGVWLAYYLRKKEASQMES